MGSGISGMKKIERRNDQPKKNQNAEAIELEEEILSTVLKIDSKTKIPKFILDLQYKEAHKEFINIVEKGKEGSYYGRFEDFGVADILVSDKDNEINKKLEDVIHYQFPENIMGMSIKSLAKEPQSLEPYLDALIDANTRVMYGFCNKNFAINKDSFSKVLSVFHTNYKVVFFGATFSELDDVEIVNNKDYSIKHLAFSYCNGLQDQDGNISPLIKAIKTSQNFSSNLMILELSYNMLKSEDEIKKELESAGLGKIRLIYNEAEKNEDEELEG